VFTVLIPDALTSSTAPEQEILGEQAAIISPRALDARTIAEPSWAAADALLVWHHVTIDATVIGWLDRCRVIVRAGVGFDNVDLAAAGRRGIKVCNVPDYGTGDVADHAVALFLALARGVVAYDEAVRTGAWGWDVLNQRIRRVSEMAVGIIGLGRIGTATARRIQALGAPVGFYDPYKEDGYDKALGVWRADTLRELLAKSDVVSLHVPLTDETSRMVDDDFVQAMKPGALLINTARGKTMDLDAVYRGLRSGHIAAAGLDVLPQEPPDAAHPLVKAWRERAAWLTGRLVLTPHVAFYSAEALEEVRRKAASEVLRVLQGMEPRNCVNRAYLE